MSGNINIVKFVNGAIKQDKGDRIQFRTFQESDPKKKRKRKFMVAEVGNATYVARNYGPLACHSSHLCRYMIGVVDKQTGKMTVHDAEMLNFTPYQKPDSDDEEEKTHKLTYSQKIDDLTTAFGSKKKRSALDSRQKNTLSADKLKLAVDDAIDQTLERSDAQQLLTVATEAGASKEIPFCNPEAATASEAYPLCGIISAGVLDVLKGAAQEFINSTPEITAQWQKEKKNADVVLRHLRILPLRKEAREERSCLLIYLHYMLHLYKTNFIKLKNKDPFSKMNVASLASRALLDRFTIKMENNKQRLMPSRLKDKLVCHILVLCLRLDDFALNVTDLCKDLMLDQTKLTDFLRSLGCKLMTSKAQGESKTIATLPVPIVFPKKRQRAPRKK